MIWINFLHLYQPVNTDARFIKEATELSYLRLIRALEENPKIKFTLNIAGGLILRWEELGYGELLSRINRLREAGQIELTGTAAYHPLLPLIPEEEVIRQIKENEEILKPYFGDSKPDGFFLPEMAYSQNIGKIIKKLGYKWIILDEIAKEGKIGNADANKIYQDKKTGLKIIFRSRKFSNSYVPDTLKKIIESGKEELVITGTDAELYGLRHNDPTGEFEKILKNKELDTKTISEFINLSPEPEKIYLQSSTWESSEAELKSHQPYVLWLDKNNKIQKKIWQLADFTYKTLGKQKNDDNASWARWHLVRGLGSCTLWWASGRDFSHIFGPNAWNPDEVEKGINELVRAVRSLQNPDTRSAKLKAEKMSLKLKKMIWEKHWNHWKK